MNAAATAPPAEQSGSTGRMLPVIAVTVGDGAGIGPEVIVPALPHPGTLRDCRPVMAGDAERPREAARIAGADCAVVAVEDPARAGFTPGRINVIDLGLLPADLPRGGLPAGTAFVLASRGDHDLVVAMYHDQGHGPVKVLGIETGVDPTGGRTVIRTSVDHGTAFDIAGTGRAEAGSMVQALCQAAEMSTAPAAR